jgi:hypothetical protein
MVVLSEKQLKVSTNPHTSNVPNATKLSFINSHFRLQARNIMMQLGHSL